LPKQRLLADPSLTERERELLRKVSGKIYFNDTMYDGDGAPLLQGWAIGDQLS